MWADFSSMKKPSEMTYQRLPGRVVDEGLRMAEPGSSAVGTFRSPPSSHLSRTAAAIKLRIPMVTSSQTGNWFGIPTRRADNTVAYVYFIQVRLLLPAFEWASCEVSTMDVPPKDQVKVADGRIPALTRPSRAPTSYSRFRMPPSRLYRLSLYRRRKPARSLAAFHECGITWWVITDTFAGNWWLLKYGLRVCFWLQPSHEHITSHLFMVTYHLNTGKNRPGGEPLMVLQSAGSGVALNFLSGPPACPGRGLQGVSCNLQWQPALSPALASVYFSCAGKGLSNRVSCHLFILFSKCPWIAGSVNWKLQATRETGKFE